MLRMQTKTTHYVDYRDFEKFIKDIFNVEIDVVVSEECGNDTSLTYEIDGKIESWETEQVGFFLQGGTYIGYGATRLALNLACQNGKIPTGSYVVEVSW